MITVDCKITIWDRFRLPDECKEEIMGFLKEKQDATSSDILEWANDNGYEPYDHQTLSDTGEELTPATNGGASTLEITQSNERFNGEYLFVNEIPVRELNNVTLHNVDVELLERQRLALVRVQDNLDNCCRPEPETKIRTSYSK